MPSIPRHPSCHPDRPRDRASGLEARFVRFGRIDLFTGLVRFVSVARALLVGALLVGAGCGGTVEAPPCEEVGCEAHATCVASACVCDPGFERVGEACVDVDECAAGTAGCDPSATCTNTSGGFACACRAGYEGDGFSCLDVDECTAGTAGCDPSATCSNAPGSFTCACDPGFEGDGFSCADVDECAAGTAGCDPSATCTNAPGSFSCACDAGFEGDGFTCDDVDECATQTDACSEDATCTNDEGSYTCACEPGFEGDGFTCEDVDECAVGLDDCAENATCTNTRGAFGCACNPGYTGDGRACVDVDECADGTAGCDENATCDNEPGSFACVCDAGWMGDGFTCEDVDECSDGTDNCDPEGATCDNVPGGFQCTCDPGFTGNGVSCTDVDECAAGLDDCAERATCTNTPGSFTCTCATGYSGNGRTCTPVFDIVLAFTTTPGAAERQAFEAAEARWEDLVAGDLPDLSPPGSVLSSCGVPSGISTIDDLVIVVSLRAIDGAGGILGRAGPRCTRSSGGLPFVGIMEFDTADLSGLSARGQLEAVILHEMGHVLGIGTLWDPANLLLRPSCAGGGSGNGADTRYTGANGVAAWRGLGGTGDVPVENALGSGSCDSHWREQGPLERELMSPVLSAQNGLSVLTLESLEDLGYTVGPAGRADPFMLAPIVASPLPPGLDLGDDIDAGPIYELRPDGTLVPRR